MISKHISSSNGLSLCLVLHIGLIKVGKECVLPALCWFREQVLQCQRNIRTVLWHLPLKQLAVFIFFDVRSEAKCLKMLVLIFMLLGLSIFSFIYFVRHNVEDIAQFSLETDDCYVYG